MDSKRMMEIANHIEDTLGFGAGITVAETVRRDMQMLLFKEMIHSLEKLSSRVEELELRVTTLEQKEKTI